MVKELFALILKLLFGEQLYAADGDIFERNSALLTSTVCGILPYVCGVVMNLALNRDILSLGLHDSHMNKVGLDPIFQFQCLLVPDS